MCTGLMPSEAADRYTYAPWSPGSNRRLVSTDTGFKTCTPARSTAFSTITIEDPVYELAKAASRADSFLSNAEALAAAENVAFPIVAQRPRANKTGLGRDRDAVNGGVLAE